MLSKVNSFFLSFLKAGDFRLSQPGVKCQFFLFPAQWPLWTSRPTSTTWANHVTREAAVSFLLFYVWAACFTPGLSTTLWGRQCWHDHPHVADKETEVRTDEQVTCHKVRQPWHRGPWDGREVLPARWHDRRIPLRPTHCWQKCSRISAGSFPFFHLV